jgi:hypothetical protein
MKIRLFDEWTDFSRELKIRLFDEWTDFSPKTEPLGTTSLQIAPTSYEANRGSAPASRVRNTVANTSSSYGRITAEQVTEKFSYARLRHIAGDAPVSNLMGQSHYWFWNPFAITVFIFVGRVIYLSSRLCRMSCHLPCH